MCVVCCVWCVCVCVCVCVVCCVLCVRVWVVCGGWGHLEMACTATATAEVAMLAAASYGLPGLGGRYPPTAPPPATLPDQPAYAA